MAAAALAPASASASEVTVVSGGHAVTRNDPLVPGPAATDLTPAPRAGASALPRPHAARSPRPVERALGKALRQGKIKGSRYRSYLRTYRRARRVRRRLKRQRGRELGYVIGVVDVLARRRRLIASRMPVMFLELRRNTQYWRRLPFPASRDDVTFRGSEILFRYFRGEGLQIHPLSTFKKANLMHGACVGAVEAPCRRQGLARLLDEMNRIAVRRSRRFIAWEYEFAFGGGVPPWMSGMAQASGIQALARASQLLGRSDYLTWAQKALGAFETPPPVGVRTTGFRGGVHYLQYSFAPRTYIFNAFTQALIGLYDYSLISGDGRALRLFQEAEPELEREIPSSDRGDWSMYSYRGEISDISYHELLREVLQSMCSRGLGEIYCKYARRYRNYQTHPPDYVRR
jgi:D-glucuronyl C5-epimerase-like protein